MRSGSPDSVRAAVIAHYLMHYSPYEEEFPTVEEAFSYLAYGVGETKLSPVRVVDGETVYRRGDPEFERQFDEAWERLNG